MASKMPWTEPASSAASARVCAVVRPKLRPRVAAVTASSAVATAEPACSAVLDALEAYTPNSRTGPVQPAAAR
jgi:hypothetical protein